VSQVDRGLPDLLAIGVSQRGSSPANELVYEALMSYMRMVIKERAAFPNEGLRLNIVFHVPGPIFQPDYQGVHATKFDRKGERVLVVAAVPAALKFDEVSRYFVDVLRQARDETTSYVAKRKVTIAMDRLDGLIEHLMSRIQAAA
jgi:hypothetical protein